MVTAQKRWPKRAMWRQVMVACFVCFTMRALLLADLVQAQAEGEDSGHFAKGWRRYGAEALLALLCRLLLRPKWPHGRNSSGKRCRGRHHHLAMF